MKSPAFQFYPKDWLSSRRVKIMTAEQRGWYIQLLCEAWESEIQGTLPYDLKLLWILAGAPNEQVFNDCSTPVIAMFELKENTLIHHRLIEEVIKQQLWSEHCAQAGRRSGEVRRQLLKDKHLAKTNTCSVSVEPKTNIASASSSASATAYKREAFTKPTHTQVEEYTKSIGFSLDAQYFLDYCETRGWKLKNGVQMKDWKAAIRTWKHNEKNGKIKNISKSIKPQSSEEIIKSMQS